MKPFEDFKFKHRNSQSVHIKTVHEKTKPIVCEFCESEFGQNHGLIRHIQTVHIWSFKDYWWTKQILPDLWIKIYQQNWSWSTLSSSSQLKQ